MSKAFYKLTPMSISDLPDHIFRVAHSPEQAVKLALRDYPRCSFSVEHVYDINETPLDNFVQELTNEL